MTTTRLTHTNGLTQYSLSEVLAVATGVAVTLVTLLVAVTYLDVALGVLLGVGALTVARHVRARLHEAVAALIRDRENVTVQTDARTGSYDAD